jgi:hypothetical protein
MSNPNFLAPGIALRALPTISMATTRVMLAGNSRRSMHPSNLFIVRRYILVRSHASYVLEEGSTYPAGAPYGPASKKRRQ